MNVFRVRGIAFIPYRRKYMHAEKVTLRPIKGHCLDAINFKWRTRHSYSLRLGGLTSRLVYIYLISLHTLKLWYIIKSKNKCKACTWTQLKDFSAVIVSNAYILILRRRIIAHEILRVMNKSIKIESCHFTGSPLNTRNVHFSPQFLECLF
jgi:hypothetical protein